MTKLLKIIGTAAATILLVSMAWAHHGWQWAEDEQTEMTGVIEDIFVGPPHPRLMITTEHGRYQVDLGNPRQTADAGFDENEAQVGDTVLVRGHRSRNPDENLIKAVRITIDDRQYTFYPQLLRED